MDNKGRNFLHVAVQNSDIESVLFLISVQANVNSRVQDAAKLTPLHLAVQAGSEIIVRNLVRSHVGSSALKETGSSEPLPLCLQLLAGAKINELTKHRQTALHLAAQQDLATICSVLLENGVDFSAEDENGNNGEGGCRRRAASSRGGGMHSDRSLCFFPSALHLAVMQGRLNNVRALLTESNIDAEAFNLRWALASFSDIS